MSSLSLSMVNNTASSTGTTLTPYVPQLASAVNQAKTMVSSAGTTFKCLVHNMAGDALDQVTSAASSMHNAAVPYVRDMTEKAYPAWNRTISVAEAVISVVKDHYIPSAANRATELKTALFEQATEIASTKVVANAAGWELVCGLGLVAAACGLASACRKRRRPQQIAENQIATQADFTAASDAFGNLISGPTDSSADSDENGGDVKRRRTVQTETMEEATEETKEEKIENPIMKDTDNAVYPEDIEMQPTQIEVSEEEEDEEDEDEEDEEEEDEEEDEEEEDDEYHEPHSAEDDPDEDQMDVEEFSAETSNQGPQPQLANPTNQTIMAVRTQPVSYHATASQKEVANVMVSMGYGKQETPKPMKETAIELKADHPPVRNPVLMPTKSNSKRLQPDFNESASEEEKEGEDHEVPVYPRNKDAKQETRQKIQARSQQNAGLSSTSKKASLNRIPVSTARGRENKEINDAIDLTGED